MERVRVYNQERIPNRAGRGLFAGAVMTELPLLPVEEEGRLNDPILCGKISLSEFLPIIAGNDTPTSASRSDLWLTFTPVINCLSGLIASPTTGSWVVCVAQAKQSPIAAANEQYSRLFMEGLARHATAKKHGNVLEHMMGYFSKELSKEGNGKSCWS